MSAYVKFVCDSCGEREIEFEAEDLGSVDSARYSLWKYRWYTFDGDICELCGSGNV